MQEKFRLSFRVFRVSNVDLTQNIIHAQVKETVHYMMFLRQIPSTFLLLKKTETQTFKLSTLLYNEFVSNLHSFYDCC